MAQQPYPAPIPDSRRESQEMATDEPRRCAVADIDRLSCYQMVDSDVRVWYPAHPELGERLACLRHAVVLGARDQAVAFAPIRPGSAIEAYRRVAARRQARDLRERDNRMNQAYRFDA